MELQVPGRLLRFRAGRLPLGTPVKYAGLACQVVGRAFSDERYDLASPGLPIMQNIPLGSLVVDFKELSNGGN